MSMMVQSGRFGPGGAGGGGVAYRYVGIQSLSSSNGGFISCAQLSMFETGSGTDCCLAGTMGTSFAINNGFVASNMNDSNTSTFMASSSAAAAFQGVVYCDFGSGVAKQITKIGWRSRSTTAENPTVWRVVGKQNSGDDWSHIAFLTDKSWTSAEYYEETIAPVGDIALLPGYRYFKFTVTASNGALCSVNEMVISESPGGTGRQPWYSAVTHTDFLAGGFEGTRMYDGNTANNGWYSGNTSYPKGTTIDFGSGWKVDPYEFTIYPRSETNIAPKDFKVEGSNDNSTWDLLFSTTNETSWTYLTGKTYASA